MPGYYVHLAATYPKARQNRSFVWGIEAPDLLKSYYKSYGLDKTRQKYNLIKTKDMPDFTFLAPRIAQTESKNKPMGLHYGLSSNPDITYFWHSLTPEQKNNPFYIGYLWHLLTDYLIYKDLDIETKYEKALSKDDFLNLLHADWDKTNSLIREKYPDVELTPEICELGVVKYNNDNKLEFIDYNVIKYWIDYLRKYNLLEQDTADILTNMKRDLRRKAVMK